MLLAGTTTGLVHVYDVASHQLLRTLSAHKGMSITHLTTMLRPPDLVGHVSLTLGAGSAGESKDGIPVRPVVPFQRIRDAKAREAHDVSLILPQTEVCRLSSRQRFHSSRCSQTKTPSFFSYSQAELIQDHAFFVKPSSAGLEASGASLQSRVTELESEVVRLREQLGKAKGINDAMWESVVQRLVAEDKEKEQQKGQGADVSMGESATQEEDGRRRKRNRT